MTTIYVGNLPANARPETLARIFRRYGEVTKVSLFPEAAERDRRSYGFVEMPALEEARRASRLLNGQPLRGRFITVVTVAAAEAGEAAAH